MKTFILIVGIVIITIYGVSIIAPTIHDQDLDTASGMLLMMYGAIIFLSELMKNPKHSQIINAISYLIISFFCFRMLIGYRLDSDIPTVFAIFVIVTSMATVVFVRNHKIIHKLDS